MFDVRLGAMILLVSGGAAFAATEDYQLALGPVARTNATKLLAVGKGDAIVTLDGNKLSIKGQFDGLASPATDAHLCQGIGIGTGAGNCATALTISQAQKGEISGDVALNARQLAALRAGQ